jgi:hypothetical protein
VRVGIGCASPAQENVTTARLECFAGNLSAEITRDDLPRQHADVSEQLLRS